MDAILIGEHSSRTGSATLVGLMSDGASVPAMYHRTVYFVDRLLKGARVADLPVELPTTWDFIINSRTAQAMGLHIPDSV